MINIISSGGWRRRNRGWLLLPVPVVLAALAACSDDRPLAPESANVGKRLSSVTAEPPKQSPLEDLALNKNPFGSDPGWGGGSYPWQIVDGQRLCAGGSQWACGIAFTGGVRGYNGPCGWRQATIDFGQPTTFNRVVVWHHALEHVPNTYKIAYWSGSAWVELFSTTNGHAYMSYPDAAVNEWWGSYSTPTDNTFQPVTGTKVRYSLNNCDIVHGWIYEFEVYLDAPVNHPPVASAGGPYAGIEGAAVGFNGFASADPDGDALTFAWNFGDGFAATVATPSHTYAKFGTYAVTLTVTDPSGASHTATTTAIIANVAPDVNPIAGATILRGETYSGTAAFTDPGADVWTATVDYGDGDGAQSLALTGNSFVLSHVYPVAGSFTLTVRVTDNGGLAGASEAMVVVQSPSRALQALEDAVAALVSAGTLSGGNGNALNAKLDAAIASLDRNNPKAAENQLNAFINQVNALAGRLPASAARALVDGVHRIIRAMSTA